MKAATRTALYRFYDSDEQLLYLGITDRLGQRWERHVKEQPWWGVVARQTTEWHDTRDEAAEAEVAAIRTEQPLHNVMHSTRPRLVAPEVLAVEGEVELANARFVELKAQLDDAQKDLFAACAEAVRVGSTPERLAEKSAFTAAYIRRKIRDRGVAPLRTGPKPRDAKE